MINPENFPVMKGNANMARGASYFEVPLFSHVIHNLWQGCSAAEFPDEMEPYNYDLTRVDSFSKDPALVALAYGHSQGKVKCHWLYEESFDEDGNPGPPVPRFDKIINLYPWGEYEVPELTEKIDITAYDGSEVDYQTFEKAAKLAIDFLEEGNKVLVHCQAGLNRSSFVVALILMTPISEGGFGMTAEQAIDRIRKSRSEMCLCNNSFADYLKAIR